MERLLVRITEAHRADYEHLVGTLAIGYPDVSSLRNVLRLPGPDSLLGGARYVRASGVEVNPLRATTFDDFREEAS